MSVTSLLPIVTSLYRINKWPLKTVLNSRPICLSCQPLVINVGVSQSSITFWSMEWAAIICHIFGACITWPPAAFLSLFIMAWPILGVSKDSE